MCDVISLLAMVPMNDWQSFHPFQERPCDNQEGRSPVGFFNPVILIKIFPQSRNPDGFYWLIPIPNVGFKMCLTEVPDPLTLGEPVEDGGIRKVLW